MLNLDDMKKEDFKHLANYVDKADVEWIVNEKWRVNEGQESRPEAAQKWKTLIIGIVQYLSDHECPKYYAPELLREYLRFKEMQLTNHLAEIELGKKTIH